MKTKRLMKNALFISLSFFFLIACQHQEEKAPFATLLKNYYENRLKLYPLEATLAGDNRYNDVLPNPLSTDYINALRAFYTSYLDSLSTYQRDALSQAEQTDYDVLKWECDIRLTELELDQELLPINQFRGLHIAMGMLGSGKSAQPFQTAEDYDNWGKRVDAFLMWCDSAVAMMKRGIAKKVVLPKVLAKKTIRQLESLAKLPVEENVFYSPIKAFDEQVSQPDRERLRDAYARMIEERIVPTLTRMARFMEEEYLPACRQTAGIGALPNGEAIYAHKIKMYTTTTMNADEIFELGTSEVKRITEEMEKVKQQVGFNGDLKAFFNHVRTRKELMPYAKPEEVIAHFNAIHQRITPHLKKLFTRTPVTAFEVRRTEAFREKTASAQYNPGSLDGSRPGIFYVPIPDVHSYNNFTDESLFLHEAIPGHHYQVSLQQENTDLPDFRKTLWYSSYGEGWALYSESLGKEMGLYQDPYQYFGMLSQEMHRAIRLVVDVGLHARGWSREKAIAYSLDHEAESEAGITAEIERYMAIPGQALSYKIGQLNIQELRKEAERRLGDAFRIDAFHDRVLQTGSIPLTLLEQQMQNWMETQKTAAKGA